MANPTWRQAVKAAERLSHEASPRTPVAANATQLHKAIASSGDSTTKAMLILAWTTSGRLGDVAQLAASDVAIADDGKMRVLFRKSKTARAKGGAHTVHTTLPKAWSKQLRAFLAGKTGDLFPKTSATVPKATEALKEVDPTLEARSLRRGSLQTLAQAGATHEELMTFSGHKNVNTLLRYLGWGWTIGPKEAGAAAKAAALAPTTTSARRRVVA